MFTLIDGYAKSCKCHTILDWIKHYSIILYVQQFLNSRYYVSVVCLLPFYYIRHYNTHNYIRYSLFFFNCSVFQYITLDILQTNKISSVIEYTCYIFECSDIDYTGGHSIKIQWMWIFFNLSTTPEFLCVTFCCSQWVLTSVQHSSNSPFLHRCRWRFIRASPNTSQGSSIAGDTCCPSWFLCKSWARWCIGVIFLTMTHETWMNKWTYRWNVVQRCSFLRFAKIRSSSYWLIKTVHRWFTEGQRTKPFLSLPSSLLSLGAW